MVIVFASGGRESCGSPRDGGQAQGGCDGYVGADRGPQPGEACAEYCAEHCSQAERRVEPGHDRLARRALDDRSLEVLRHVPDPEAEPEQEQPRHHKRERRADLHHQAGEGNTGHAHRCAEPDSFRSAEVIADPPGQRQAQYRSGRDHQKQDAQLAWRQVQAGLDVRYP